MIKTWRQRLGLGDAYPLHAPTDVERAMIAEIAELRAGDADNLSAMLWLLRRLPRTYGNPPHIVQAIKRVSGRTSIGVDDVLAERATVDVPTRPSSGFASPLSMVVLAGLAMVVIAFAYTQPTPELWQAPPAPTPGTSVAYAPYVFIDDATGCNYLSTHNSTALAPRMAADGKTHMGCKGVPR